MITVVTHADSDGVLCLATLMRAAEQDFEARFSSPAALLSMLRGIESETLYIFDISGTREAILEASRSREVLWIDHHVWEPALRPGNIEFHIDSSAKSACTLVSRHFQVSGFEGIAEEIDTNSVASEEADKIRKIVAYYKGLKAYSKPLLRFSRELARHGVEAIRRYKREIAAYEEKLKLFEEVVMRRVKVRKINELNIAVLEAPMRIPIYVACNKLREHEAAPFDVILVTSRASGRVELRTHTDYDVLRIARIFGGGGHRVASGAKAKPEDVLTAISFLR
jgi:oligoribonuclease NrnB/cAMP/cGMP phosphodiesterase (DHH superfamily)